MKVQTPRKVTILIKYHYFIWIKNPQVIFVGKTTIILWKLRVKMVSVRNPRHHNNFSLQLKNLFLILLTWTLMVFNLAISQLNFFLNILSHYLKNYTHQCYIFSHFLYSFHYQDFFVSASVSACFWFFFLKYYLYI